MNVPWALKVENWTEVRPYEDRELTDSEQLTIGRRARVKLHALRIPESDPAWDHVRYRRPESAPATATARLPIATESSKTTSSTRAETKCPVTAPKDHPKPKYKADRPRERGETQNNDEYSKAAITRVNAIKQTNVEQPSTPSDGSSATKTVTTRRLPGSGYRANKLSHTAVIERLREQVYARAAAVSKPSPLGPLTPKPPQQDEHPREKQKVSKETTTGGPPTGLKRKASIQDAENTPDDGSSKSSLPKRQKLDRSAVASTSSTAGLPQRPVHESSALHRLKFKKIKAPPGQAPAPKSERDGQQVGRRTSTHGPPRRA